MDSETGGRDREQINRQTVRGRLIELSLLTKHTQVASDKGVYAGDA